MLKTVSDIVSTQEMSLTFINLHGIFFPREIEDCFFKLLGGPLYQLRLDLNVTKDLK